MTRRKIFLLQLISAVLVIAAMVYFGIYATEVFVPRMMEQVNSNPGNGQAAGVFWAAMAAGVAVAVVVAILLTWAVIGGIVGLYLLVVCLAMRKSTRRTLYIVLNIIASALLIVHTVLTAMITSNDIGFAVTAVICVASCVMWAVQFVLSLKHLYNGKPTIE